MTSVASLHKRIKRMHQEIREMRPPQCYILTVAPGEDPTPEQLTQIGPHDIVTIEEVYPFYLTGSEDGEIGSYEL